MVEHTSQLEPPGMDIRSYLKERSEVFDTSLGDFVVFGHNSIKIDRQYYTTVSTDRELGMALEKRRINKHTLYRGPYYKGASMAVSVDRWI